MDFNADKRQNFVKASRKLAKGLQKTHIAAGHQMISASVSCM